jgi:hypothetical protein
LKVLQEAEKGHLTQKQAGAQLKLSERRVRKLGEAVRAKVVRLVKREYADFGPTLAAEYLGEKHGVVVSKESVRQTLMDAGVWNRRFTVEAENGTDAHRPLRAEHHLAAILSHVEERVVANDYTIRYKGKIYQIPRTDIRPGLRGATVMVEERRDQTVRVRFRDRSLEVSRFPSGLSPPPPPRSGQSQRLGGEHRAALG